MVCVMGCTWCVCVWEWGVRSVTYNGRPSAICRSKCGYGHPLTDQRGRFARSLTERT